MKIRENELGIEIFSCDKLYKKILGFMFYKKPIKHGLILNKCNAIHTFFMFQPIDVIMTDKNDNILFVYEGLKPWKIITPKKGVSKTYELPLGIIKKIKD